MSKSVFMEHTQVPSFRSISDIQYILTQAGAVAINQRMKDKRINGVSFTLPLNRSLLAFELPARVEPVLQNLLKERRREPKPAEMVELRKKAENVAWRQLSKWLEAQLAIVGLGMVEAREVFMPYCLGDDGRTMYEHWKGRLLEAPKEKENHG